MIGGTRRRFLLVDIKLATKRPGYIEVSIVRAVESGDGAVWQDGPVALSCRRIVGRDLRLTRLVDVAEAKKLCASRTNVSHLNKSLTELLLNVEVEILGVGCADVLV